MGPDDLPSTAGRWAYVIEQSQSFPEGLDEVNLHIQDERERAQAGRYCWRLEHKE